MFKALRIILAAFLLAGAIAPSSADAATKRKKKRARAAQQGFSAQSSILLNVTGNKVLFEKNADKRVYPASTTKVMTIMLALEKLDLEQYVTVSARATQVPPTKLDLRPGEQYKVGDLVHACMLKSANDAAGVLAEAVAGSQEAFVEMMNAKAQAIGAVNTKFANPSGLPSAGIKQYTTARDMALILKEALKNPFFEKSSTYQYRQIYSKTGRRHFLKSHNKSLFMGWKTPIYGKTGYTLQARSCFVGYFRKGNDMFILDVFGCRTQRRWPDVKWLAERYTGVKL